MRLDVMLVLLFPRDGHRAVRHHRGDRQALCTGVSHSLIYSAHKLGATDPVTGCDSISWSRGLWYKAPRSKAAVDIIVCGQVAHITRRRKKSLKRFRFPVRRCHVAPPSAAQVATIPRDLQHRRASKARVSESRVQPKRLYMAIGRSVSVCQRKMQRAGRVT